MSITYIAYATSADNTIGADEGISVYRKDVESGQVMDEREIAAWTADGKGISDEDGDLDTDKAEARLAAMGYQVTGAGWQGSGGQWAIEVEQDWPSVMDNWAGRDERHLLQRDDLVRAAKAAGVNVRQIAVHMGISRTTVYKILEDS